MPRVRLNIDAMRIAGVLLTTPMLARVSTWDSEVEFPEEQPDPPTFIAPGLAFVDIRGVLLEEPDTFCGYVDGYLGPDGIAARFERAAAHPDTEAIFMHFKCPGGTSRGIIECHRRMLAARDAAGVPVIGYVKEACSAGYWLATVCDGGLWGDEDLEAGSIGAYVPHKSIAAMLEQQGIVITLVADPPGKVAGNPYQPLSEVGLSRLDRGIKKCTARFRAVVSAARPALTEDVLVALDGDVLEGEDAYAAGIVDGIADLATTIDLALAIAAERKAA